MKIVVNKAKLAAALKKSKVEAEENFKLSSLTFESKQNVALAQYVKNVRKYADDVEKKKLEPEDSYDLETLLNKSVKFPDEPKEESKVKEIERMLSKLNIIEGDTLELNEKDNYLQYI